MLVFDGPVTPDDITTFTREVPVSDGFILEELLPNRYFEDFEVDFQELVKTNRVARFRNYDGRIHVSTRDAMSTKKVKLPPLSSSLNMGEYERLLIEFARTGGTREEAKVRAVYNDAENLTSEVLNRMELARGDALTDFKFSMFSNPALGEPTGLDADFGAPDGHLVAPATLWTDITNSTPLTDLRAWNRTYRRDNGGARGGTLWTSIRVAELLQRNKEVIDAVYGAQQGRTYVTLEELNRLLLSDQLPTVRTYDANVDVDGTITPIIPDNRLLITPSTPGALGYTAWGISATALELVNSAQVDLSFERAPGIVGVIIKVGPPFREFIYVDAVGMPIISNPRALMVATVAPENA